MATLRRQIGPGTTAVVAGAVRALGQAINPALGEWGARVIRTGAPAVVGADRVLDVIDPAAARALAGKPEPQAWVDDAGVPGTGEALDRPVDEIRRHAVVGTPSAVGPFSGRCLLEPAEGPRPASSLPAGRAALAKGPGLWPTLGVATRRAGEHRGRRNQAGCRARYGSEVNP